MCPKQNESRKHNNLPLDCFFLDPNMDGWNPQRVLLARVLLSLENGRL